MTKFNGNKMRELRTKNNMTTRELSKRIDVTNATITRYEQGQREPSLETIGQIARVLDVNTFELIDNNKTLSEQYRLTLEQEVMKEYAAYVMNKLLNLIELEKVTDQNHPLTILRNNLSYIKNDQILDAESLLEIHRVEGSLQSLNSYIDDLIHGYTRDQVAS